MEGGDVTMKVIEEYGINKMNFKKLTKKINDKKEWNLQRYKTKDGYIVCGQCESKIACNNICGDCFCQHCLEFNDDCKC